ncbi:hypothetical protein C8R44DRAFT_430973 [Mycena epipterygia]|nr:hypothetical protein C8R44DRAFT_430973 [Mycena epipterygia]
MPPVIFYPFFDVVASWKEGPPFHLLKDVPTGPKNPAFVSTVDWVRNITLWLLGGLISSQEWAHLLNSPHDVQVSKSPNFGEDPITGGPLPLSRETENVFYVHLPSSIPKPLVETDWRLERGDKPVPPDIRFDVQTRSLNHCVLSNLYSRKTDTHQVAHIIARHCSPTAVNIFSMALQRFEVDFPRMSDLKHPTNLIWLSKTMHGPLDRDKWAVYLPTFTIHPDTADITSTTLRIHHFKTDLDLQLPQCPDPLAIAIEEVNSARAMSEPPTTYIESHKCAGHTALPPLAYMYRDCDPSTEGDIRTSPYPHPVLFRVHYAVACALNWGSRELCDFVFGRNASPTPKPDPSSASLERKRGSDWWSQDRGQGGGSDGAGDTAGFETDDEVEEEDEDATESDDEALEREALERETHLKHRAMFCHFVMGNFLRFERSRWTN